MWLFLIIQQTLCLKAMNLNDVLVFCRLENSATNLSGSPKHDGPGAAGANASSLLEVWKICHSLIDIHYQ